MRLIYLLGGILFLFIPLFSLKYKLDLYHVQENGVLVSAVLTEVPNCQGTKTNPSIKFTCQGGKYSKKVGCNYADDHKSGDTILLKTIQGSNLFLFEHESAGMELIAMAALALLGVFFVYRFFKK